MTAGGTWPDDVPPGLRALRVTGVLQGGLYRPQWVFSLSRKTREVVGSWMTRGLVEKGRRAFHFFSSCEVGVKEVELDVVPPSGKSSCPAC